MIGLRNLLRTVKRDEQGATIVEFGFIALPMVLLLLGGLEMAYQAYARTVLQGALNDAARRAAVENPTFTVEGSTIEEKVENEIKNQVGIVAVNSTITVDMESYFDFSSIGNPEKLMTDNNGNGKYDAEDNDCWEDLNGNEQYDTDAGTTGRGGSNDVVFYTANISMPELFPVSKFIGTDPTVDMTLKAAIRNQPYGTQATPAVLCS